jgi:hypothetical protein
MATKKSASKKTAPPTKKANGEAPTASTQITYNAAREKNGPKTKLLALVPRKGTITVKALTAKAETEGIKPGRIPKFVAFLARYGYVDLA